MMSVRMAMSASSRRLTKLRRRVWHVARLVDPAASGRKCFKEAASAEELADKPTRWDEVSEQGEDVLSREGGEQVLRPAGTFKRFEPGYLQIEDPLVKEEEMVLNASGRFVGPVLAPYWCGVGAPLRSLSTSCTANEGSCCG